MEQNGRRLEGNRGSNGNQREPEGTERQPNRTEHNQAGHAHAVEEQVNKGTRTPLSQVEAVDQYSKQTSSL